MRPADLTPAGRFPSVDIRDDPVRAQFDLGGVARLTFAAGMFGPLPPGDLDDFGDALRWREPDRKKQAVELAFDDAQLMSEHRDLLVGNLQLRITDLTLTLGGCLDGRDPLVTAFLDRLHFLTELNDQIQRHFVRLLSLCTLVGKVARYEAATAKPAGRAGDLRPPGDDDRVAGR